MIKIPWSTNKVKRRLREEEQGQIGGYLWLPCLLCGLTAVRAAAVAESAATGRVSLWGCVSVAVSSPLMTCFLPCLCESLSTLNPAQRERETQPERGREREWAGANYCTAHLFISPPYLLLLLLPCPSLPFCFPVFKSASGMPCL